MKTRADLTPLEHQAVDQIERVDFKRVLDPLVDELKNQNDRAAVVVGGAQLDALLEGMLEQFLLERRNRPSERDPLLGESRPLGSFSSRIEVAYRLGLIGRDFSHSLDLVRQIRNDFAHNVGDRNLDKSPHRERIAELYSQMQAAMPSPTYWRMEVARFGENGPANRFRASVAYLTAMLLADTAILTKLRRQPLLSANWEPPRRQSTKTKTIRVARAMAGNNAVAADGDRAPMKEASSRLRPPRS